MVTSISGATQAADSVSQSLVIGYVVAAALVAALLLWTLIRRHRQRQLAAHAVARRLRPSTPAAHPWHDSGLPTEPAAWGYKLGDFGDLASTDTPASNAVPDTQPDSVPAHSTTPLRKMRRLKPARRPAQQWSALHG